MRWIWLAWVLLVLAVGGCAGGGVGSTQADFIKALSQDMASNCIVLSTPYGGAQIARAGGPGTKVQMSGGTCSIETAYPPEKP